MFPVPLNRAPSSLSRAFIPPMPFNIAQSSLSCALYPLLCWLRLAVVVGCNQRSVCFLLLQRRPRGHSPHRPHLPSTWAQAVTLWPLSPCRQCPRPQVRRHHQLIEVLWRRVLSQCCKEVGRSMRLHTFTRSLHRRSVCCPHTMLTHCCMYSRQGRGDSFQNLTSYQLS